MIAPQEPLSYLKAKPFRPFRIHMTSGKTLDVCHPKLAQVGRNELMVFTLATDSPEIIDDWETRSLMLMQRVSHLDSPVSQA